LRETKIDETSEDGDHDVDDDDDILESESGRKAWTTKRANRNGARPSF